MSLTFNSVCYIYIATLYELLNSLLTRIIVENKMKECQALITSVPQQITIHYLHAFLQFSGEIYKEQNNENTGLIIM